MSRGRYSDSRLAWEPSQYGLPALRLQVHNATVFSSSRMNNSGLKGVVRCAPSQNGWFLDSPQAQKPYSPVGSSTTMGFLPAILGLSMATILPGPSRLLAGSGIYLFWSETRRDLSTKGFGIQVKIIFDFGNAPE